MPVSFFWCKASVSKRKWRQACFSFQVSEVVGGVICYTVLQVPCYCTGSCRPPLVTYWKVLSAVFNKRQCMWRKAIAKLCCSLVLRPSFIAARERWHWCIILQSLKILATLTVNHTYWGGWWYPTKLRSNRSKIPRIFFIWNMKELEWTFSALPEMSYQFTFSMDTFV